MPAPQDVMPAPQRASRRPTARTSCPRCSTSWSSGGTLAEWGALSDAEWSARVDRRSGEVAGAAGARWLTLRPFERGAGADSARPVQHGVADHGGVHGHRRPAPGRARSSRRRAAQARRERPALRCGRSRRAARPGRGRARPRARCSARTTGCRRRSCGSWRTASWCTSTSPGPSCPPQHLADAIDAFQAPPPPLRRARLTRRVAEPAVSRHRGRAAHLQARRGRPDHRDALRAPRQGARRRQGRAQDEVEVRRPARAAEPRPPAAVPGARARHRQPGRVGRDARAARRRPRPHHQRPGAASRRSTRSRWSASRRRTSTGCSSARCAPSPSGRGRSSCRVLLEAARVRGGQPRARRVRAVRARPSRSSRSTWTTAACCAARAAAARR